MAILPTTFAFLFILMLLAMYECVDLQRAACMRKMYQEQFYEEEAGNCTKLAAKVEAAYTSLTRQSQDDYDCIDQDEATVPADSTSSAIVPVPGGPARNTRFLHIGSLFSSNGNDQNKQASAQLFLAALMRALYENEEFFKEAEAKCPELDKVLVQAIIDKANEQKKRVPIKSAKDLAGLDLEDPILKEAIYYMLQGTKKRKKNSEQRPGWFSLTAFVSFRNQNAVASVWLAPKPILMALFGDAVVVEAVCRRREGMRKKARKAEQSDLTVCEQDLKNDFASALPAKIDTSTISFRVTATEPRDW